jgi:hypothetical protein
MELLVLAMCVMPLNTALPLSAMGLNATTLWTTGALSTSKLTTGLLASFNDLWWLIVSVYPRALLLQA